jgi:exopolysaccharide production protein ExoQ
VHWIEPHVGVGFQGARNQSLPQAQGRLLRIGLLALMVAVMAQQCGAWIRPAYEFIDLKAHVFDDPWFGLFQKAIFVCEAALFVFVIGQKGLRPLLGVLKPLWPFFACGVVSAALGSNIFGSARILFYWLMMALTAASLSLVLDRRDLARGMLIGLSLILGGSILLVLVAPASGMMVYSTGPVWRGLMSSKNDLGWIAALGLCVAVFPAAIAPGRRMLSGRIALGVVSLACLVASQSKTALLTAVAAIILWSIMTLLRKRWSAALVLLVTVVLVAAFLGLVIIHLADIEALLRSIGRDLTFTGRDDVWNLYAPEIMKSPWIGEGPGAYTLASQYTVPLAHRLMGYGLILTPHNMYLATIGDGGIIALSAKLGALLFFIERALRHSASTPLGVMTIALLIGGVSETREVFSNGPTMYLSLIAWGALLAVRRGDR